MKIVKPTQTILRQLRKQREALNAALKPFLAGNSELNKLIQRASAIRAEIAQLEEEGDPSDKTAVATLGSLRTEIALNETRQGQISARGTPAAESLAAELHLAGEATRQALLPTMAKYEADIAKSLKPFYRAPFFGDGIRKARETDACIALSLFVRRVKAEHGPSASGAMFTLDVMKQILDGELNWSFDPSK